MDTPVIQTLPENTQGRDFVVGDIHGHFDTLERAMEAAKFDPAQDRLISVGDMVDRGPQSHRVFDFLKQHWFHAIRGNHEQNHIEFVPILFGEDNDQKEAVTNLYTRKASSCSWAMDYLPDVLQHFLLLPYALEIETSIGKIGVVHAETPIGMDWADFKDALQDSVARNDASFLFESEHNRAKLSQNIKARALWGGSRLRHYMDDTAHDEDHTVSGITRIFMGHNTVRRRLRMGNNFFIDTGRCYRGRMVLGAGDLSHGHISMIDMRAKTADILASSDHEDVFRVVEHRP